MNTENKTKIYEPQSRSTAGLGLLPCPFCGEQPEISDLGTCIDFDCCVSMSLQKSDVLTIEERETFSMETYKYSDEAEAKAMAEIVSMWNTRMQPNVK